MADFETEDMLEQERQKSINQWPDDDEEEAPLKKSDHPPVEEEAVENIE